MEQNLWRSPGQPPAPSRSGCKARESWSAPCPAEFWKSPRMELPHLSGYCPRAAPLSRCTGSRASLVTTCGFLPLQSPCNPHEQHKVWFDPPPSPPPGWPKPLSQPPQQPFNGLSILSLSLSYWLAYCPERWTEKQTKYNCIKTVFNIYFFLCRRAEEFSSSSDQKRKPQTPTLVTLFTQGGMQEFWLTPKYLWLPCITTNLLRVELANPQSHWRHDCKV